jgi:hypothetical protein
VQVLLLAGHRDRQREQAAVRITPARRVESRAVPGDIRKIAAGHGSAVEEAVRREARMAPPECDELAHEPVHGAARLDQAPVEPRDVVVLRVGVVVAALRAQHLVAGEEHRNAA